MRAFPLHLLGCLLLLPGSVLHAGAGDRKGRPDLQAKAGLVTRDVTPAVRRNWRGSSDHTLHVTVWYPAAKSATETPQAIGPPDKPLFSAGSAVPHAAFAPSLQPFPLILLSPGAGDSALQMAWLGTALARAGFVAAAVDHPGNDAVAGTTPEGFLLWWERATDLSEVLDGLLADAELGPHIDKERIGAAGFALGGTTVLELAGARTDLSAFTDLCHREVANPDCSAPERKGLPGLSGTLDAVRKTSGESLARSGESYRDPRLRAVFAIAPALGFTLTPESLHSVRMPVELVVGSADSLAPAANNADRIKANVRGARETVLPHVTHDTFLDICTAAGKATLGAECADPAGVDREAVHTAVAEMAAKFFGRTL